MIETEAEVKPKPAKKPVVKKKAAAPSWRSAEGFKIPEKQKKPKTMKPKENLVEPEPITFGSHLPPAPKPKPKPKEHFVLDDSEYDAFDLSKMVPESMKDEEPQAKQKRKRKRKRKN